MWKNMNDKLLDFAKPKTAVPLDSNFQPAVLWNHSFNRNVLRMKNNIPLSIIIERGNDILEVYKTSIFEEDPVFSQYNDFYIENLVKTLLWIYGGNKIIINGPAKIGRYIEKIYSSKGPYAFDVNFMSTIFEKSFTVDINNYEKVEISDNGAIQLGGHLNGGRIGFDLGASDRKVSAVMDGKVVFSEEVLWNPSMQTDPDYHYNEIMSMLENAAKHLPRVQAIGGSAAGIYVDNRVMNASIFRAVSPENFDKKVKDLFINLQKKWGVPLKVINDGEVTALAGSMYLKKNAVLGIALGSSEAGGYINKNGSISKRINELAFVPLDFNANAPVDDWSSHPGCGVQYLSQLAAIRLARKAGIRLEDELSPAGKLKYLQELIDAGDKRTVKVFKTIGCYLGYGIAHYADFYDIESILILGRVTSGEGGKIILKNAKDILKIEFPKLADNIMLHLPDEKSRRVGQAIAAASLPLIEADSRMN